MLTALIAGAALAIAPGSTEITAKGPLAPLAGTMINAGKDAPVLLIIPGSGPTDRDGNNPMGVSAAPYRMLAEALAAKGVSSVRVDKRGMFASRAAVADPNAVTIKDYASDTHRWVAAIRQHTGAPCVWVLGHSEGGLVALAAGQDPAGICGVIALAAPGRKLGFVLREQLRANPANAPILDQAMAAIDQLELGQDVDTAGMPPALLPLFHPKVQPFLKDLLAQDPAALAASLSVPLLIVYPEADLQVAMSDAKALAAAQPKAKLVVVPGANHVLKVPSGAGRPANLATYRDPSLPVAEAIVDAIADFLKR